MIQIHPYNLGSKGAKALCNWLEDNGTHSIISSRMKKKGRVLVGWGAKEFNFDPTGSLVLNHPDKVRDLTCKLRFFQRIGHKPFIPEWTTDPNVAKEWDNDIVVRATTTGHSGHGITVLPARSERIPKAPLYTRYQKKTEEYRVHCFFDWVEGCYRFLHIQKKVFIKTPDRQEPLDWKIRNHSHGFTFCTVPEETVPKEVFASCTECLEPFIDDVNFVALDVVFHEPTRVSIVLEGNTAPGLEGERLALYGNYFAKVHKEYKSR